MGYRLRRLTRFILILVLIFLGGLLVFRWRYSQVIMDLAKTQVINSTSEAMATSTISGFFTAVPAQGRMPFASIALHSSRVATRRSPGFPSEANIQAQ